MKNSNILITGGNRGIGFGLAKMLLSNGNKVFITSRTLENANNSANIISHGEDQLENNIFPFELDLTSENSISQFINQIKERKIAFDIIFHNAGTSEKNYLNENIELNYNESVQILLTNYFGTKNLSNYLFKNDLINKGAKIIFLGSGKGRFKVISNEELKEKLKESNLSIEELDYYAHYFLHSIKMGFQKAKGFISSSYSTSKLFINLYASLIGRDEKVIENNIQVYSCCPGWVRTDLGGENAPMSVEEGIETPIWLSQAFDNINPKYQGKLIVNKKVRKLGN